MPPEDISRQQDIYQENYCLDYPQPHNIPVPDFFNEVRAERFREKQHARLRYQARQNNKSSEF